MKIAAVCSLCVLGLAACVALREVRATDPAGDSPPSPGSSAAAPKNSSVVEVGQKLRGQKLIIGTIESEPYVHVVQGHNGAELRGFIPDLVRMLSRRLGFKYELRLLPSALHGFYNNNTKAWTGLIGKVIKREPDSPDGVDMAAAAISITSARQEVVSFVKPFMRHGLTVVVQRPRRAPDEDQTRFYFTVLQAFDASVWSCTAVSAVVVGLVLWAMNMYNPYEYGYRFELGLADKAQAEAFNLRGALWFVFTSLLWQGYPTAPRSVASKFIGCIWFAFVTIFLTTFAAGVMNNLFWATLNQAPLATPARLYPIDLTHLLNSKVNPYKCGTIANSQTYDYIERIAVGGEFNMLRSYWQTEEGRSQMVSNITEGLERVRKEKYAFIMERAVANYYMNKRPCDLINVGEDFGMRSYGFAVPKNSKYLEDFHEAILMLDEEGELEELQDLWFKDRGECQNETVGRRREDRPPSRHNSVERPRSVDTTMFAAPLALLIVGVSGGAVIAVAEMLYYTYKGKYTSQTSRRVGTRMRLEGEDGRL